MGDERPAGSGLGLKAEGGLEKPQKRAENEHPVYLTDRIHLGEFNHEHGERRAEHTLVIQGGGGKVIILRLGEGWWGVFDRGETPPKEKMERLKSWRLCHGSRWFKKGENIARTNNGGIGKDDSKKKTTPKPSMTVTIKKGHYRGREAEKKKKETKKKKKSGENTVPTPTYEGPRTKGRRDEEDRRRIGISSRRGDLKKGTQNEGSSCRMEKEQQKPARSSYDAKGQKTENLCRKKP